MYSFHHVALSVTNREQSANFSTSTDLPIIGTKHFGLRVDSVCKAKDDLVVQGLINQSVEIKQGRTGPRFFFIKDPDGILVEIAEDDRSFWNE
jgi:glyoxylase I family protein